MDYVSCMLLHRPSGSSYTPDIVCMYIQSSYSTSVQVADELVKELTETEKKSSSSEVHIHLYIILYTCVQYMYIVHVHACVVYLNCLYKT